MTASARLHERGMADVAKGDLAAAASAFREAIRQQPASYAIYDELHNVYDLLQRNDEKQGRKAERIEHLRSSMHAAQLAAWLAPESARSAMNIRLLEARNVFAKTLLAANDRKSSEAALGLMQEAVVVADGLVQREPDNPGYRFALADAKCGLGMVRRKLGVPGWDHAIRNGLIDIRRAMALAPERAEFRAKEASWRRSLE